jgi:hypothetical protein
MFNDNDDPAIANATNALRNEARRFKQKVANDQRTPLTLVVADFEFKYDMKAFRQYQLADNDGTKGWVRWPFNHLIAGAWTSLTFKPDAVVPEVEQLVTLTGDGHCERAIAEAFFDMLEQEPSAICVSWGGETKDWPVLRRIAAELGMPLPPQLMDMRIHAPTRLDLCNATSGQSKCVHLPEYCHASGIPSKPFQSQSVGPAALYGDWDLIAEQVQADAFAASIIAIRHAISHRMATADIVASEQAIAAAFVEAYPQSPFFRNAGRQLANARTMPISAMVA